MVIRFLFKQVYGDSRLDQEHILFITNLQPSVYFYASCALEMVYFTEYALNLYNMIHIS